MKNYTLHLVAALAAVIALNEPVHAGGLDRPDRPSPKKTAEVEPPKPLTATLAPNAANTFTKITAVLSRPANVNVEFVSLNGGRAHMESYPSRTAGEHIFEIDVQTLAAGLYYVKVTDDKSAVVLPLIVVR